MTPKPDYRKPLPYYLGHPPKESDPQDEPCRQCGAVPSTTNGYCSACRKGYAKKWYAKNKQKQVARSAESNRNRRLSLKKLIDRKKRRPCMDCNGTFPTEAMEFDHVRGVKKFTISRAMGYTTFEAMEEEMAKCEVVCAICHRIRTRARRLAAPKPVPKSVPRATEGKSNLLQMPNNKRVMEAPV